MKRTWHTVNRWQTVNVVTGELCKLWRKQYLRLAITIKALRQVFTVCQRAWLADCELRTRSVFACATHLNPNQQSLV